MANFKALTSTPLSLRTRITIWYVLLVAATLVIFSTFLYFRLQDSLLSQLDASLEAASNQALLSLNDSGGSLIFAAQEFEIFGQVESFTENQIALTDGTLLFYTGETIFETPLSVGMHTEIDAQITGRGLLAIEVDESDSPVNVNTQMANLVPHQTLESDGFAIRILNQDAEVSDGIGDYANVPFPLPQDSGFTTLESDSESDLEEDDTDWRLHSMALVSPDGSPSGWVQTAGSIESVNDALEGVRNQLAWGVPLVIVMAALGGFFLADRGLRPISQITLTAQKVTGSDLSRRIDYQGANDEVGRLASTFDAMLNRLETAFQRERQFTSDVSHELRTPLTGLKGQIDVALSKIRTPSEYEDTLHGMNDEVDRLIRLSSELLFLARLEQGKLSWQPEKVSVNYMVSAVLDQIRPLADAKNLTLTESVPDNLMVYGDPDYLIRLLLNLVDNAYKYTPQGGEIVAHAKRTTDSVNISISDNGLGISEEDLPHLFDRFYRVDKARSRESGGAGLGLSIAYEIAQLHKGKLEVKSRVGEGTTFKVVFPDPLK